MIEIKNSYIPIEWCDRTIRKWLMVSSASSEVKKCNGDDAMGEGFLLCS